MTADVYFGSDKYTVTVQFYYFLGTSFFFSGNVLQWAGLATSIGHAARASCLLIGRVECC